MTDKIREALRAVIQYNWDKEIADYGDNGCPSGHVFEHLVVLDNAVEGISHTPKQWVKEYFPELLEVTA